MKSAAARTRTKMHTCVNGCFHHQNTLKQAVWVGVCSQYGLMMQDTQRVSGGNMNLVVCFFLFCFFCF